jgi:hypothetical protein
MIRLKMFKGKFKYNNLFETQQCMQSVCPEVMFDVPVRRETRMSTATHPWNSTLKSRN